MQLTKVHVTEFQSINDSTEFDVGDVTCLVGKNEAGKSALLRALYRLKPILDGAGDFDVTDCSVVNELRHLAPVACS